MRRVFLLASFAAAAAAAACGGGGGGGPGDGGTDDGGSTDGRPTDSNGGETDSGTPPVCGDGTVEGDEQCDDGNTMDGDGCDASCMVEPTAFRATSMELVDPHLYAQVLGCMDITDTANGEFQNAIDDYSLNLVDVFRPLEPSMATTPTELVPDAMCEMGSPDSCTRDPSAEVVMTTANNEMSGTTCYSADPSTLTDGYASPNSPAGPCFSTEPQSVTLTLGGIDLTLQDTQVAAEYSGAGPDRLVNGVLVGFLSVADAMATTLPSDLPLVGGDTLYEHLAHGGAPGSSCSDNDDSDMNGGTEGFWFYVSFEAQTVAWTEP